MSVFMMLQVEGDPGRPAEVMSDADEWESAEGFQIWHPVDTPDQV